MSHSSRSPTRRRSKHLAKHPQPWQGMTRRSGHAAGWDDEDVASDSGKGPQQSAHKSASHPHHIVQEPDAMYNRTQQFKQKVAQRWAVAMYDILCMYYVSMSLPRLISV